mgnify:CR=1 FL=1
MPLVGALLGPISALKTRKPKNLIKFQSKQARVFVANPATASEGLNLFVANNVIYYSNSFKYGERQQSEDRAHRIGQKNNVLYFDLIAENTLDNKIIKRMAQKYDLPIIDLFSKFKEKINHNDSVPYLSLIHI